MRRMSQSGERSKLVSTDTKVTAFFAVLGVLVWAASREVTESRILQFAALVGVGVVVPTLVNEWRG
jgi:hypothetical protein